VGWITGPRGTGARFERSLPRTPRKRARHLYAVYTLEKGTPKEIRPFSMEHPIVVRSMMAGANTPTTLHCQRRRSPLACVHLKDGCISRVKELFYRGGFATGHPMKSSRLDPPMVVRKAWSAFLLCILAVTREYNAQIIAFGDSFCYSRVCRLKIQNRSRNHPGQQSPYMLVSKINCSKNMHRV